MRTANQVNWKKSQYWFLLLTVFESICLCVGILKYYWHSCGFITKQEEASLLPMWYVASLPYQGVLTVVLVHSLYFEKFQKWKRLVKRTPVSPWPT